MPVVQINYREWNAGYCWKKTYIARSNPALKTKRALLHYAVNLVHEGGEGAGFVTRTQDTVTSDLYRVRHPDTKVRFSIVVGAVDFDGQAISLQEANFGNMVNTISISSASYVLATRVIKTDDTLDLNVRNPFLFNNVNELLMDIIPSIHPQAGQGNPADIRRIGLDRFEVPLGEMNAIVSVLYHTYEAVNNLLPGNSEVDAAGVVVWPAFQNQACELWVRPIEFGHTNLF